MRIEEPSTRYQLAYSNKLHHWPTACPACGDSHPFRRPLQAGPGGNGAARYQCDVCHTVLTPTRETIEEALRRREDAATPAEVRTVAMVDTGRSHAVMAYRTDSRWGYMCTCGAGESLKVSDDPFDPAAAISWGRAHLREVRA